jgi:hypothetical protein
MATLDDDIARKLAQAAEAGELASAPSYGKPLAVAEGWDDTPAELRMPFKILKDAGVVPHEIEMFRERANLRAQIAQTTDDAAAQPLLKRLAELEQAISLRLEALRATGSL